MSTIKATTLSNLAGSKTVPTDTVVDGSAKAWVNFNGTGTVAIRRAFNVSSITDNGTGDYTVNFTNAMPDINYCLSSSVGGQTSGGNSSNSVAMIGDFQSGPTVGSVRVVAAIASTGTLTDHQRICFSIFS